jgi:hypothetical protein
LSAAKSTHTKGNGLVFSEENSSFLGLFKFLDNFFVIPTLIKTQHKITYLIAAQSFNFFKSGVFSNNGLG